MDNQNITIVEPVTKSINCQGGYVLSKFKKRNVSSSTWIYDDIAAEKIFRSIEEIALYASIIGLDVYIPKIFKEDTIIQQFTLEDLNNGNLVLIENYMNLNT